MSHCCNENVIRELHSALMVARAERDDYRKALLRAVDQLEHRSSSQEEAAQAMLEEVRTKVSGPA